MAATDMMGLMLKGMGLNPDALMQTATKLGEAFERMAAGQADTTLRLAALQAGQDAIMGAMGLSVPPPAGDMLALIEAESRRHVDAFGGPAARTFDA